MKEIFKIKSIYSKWIVIAVFVIHLFTGLFIFKDYGINWDEPNNREIGGFACFYAHEKINQKVFDKKTYETTYHGFGWSTYGPAYEMFLYAAEKITNAKDTRQQYLTRHLMILLTFWLAVVCLYFILKIRYEDWRIAILGSIFLILSPHIFSHSFYNSRDLILLCFFIFGIRNLIWVLQSKKIIAFILLALICAISIDIRVSGLILVVVSLFFIITDALKSEKPILEIKKIALPLIIYLTIIPIVVFTLWPFLWEAPIKNFLAALDKMSHYPAVYEMSYWNGTVISTNLPWHYIFTHIFISNPIIYFPFFIIGIIAVLFKFLKNPLKIYTSEKQKLDLLFLSVFVIPVFAVIVLNSTLYGWRHIFFVYAGYMLTVIHGVYLSFVFLRKKSKKIGVGVLITIIALSCLSTIFSLIEKHPFQQAYCNSTAYFFKPTDWGITHKQGLEYILENDNRKEIKIHTQQIPGKYNSRIISPEERKRLKYTDIKEADYIIFMTGIQNNQGINYIGKMYNWKDEFFSIRSDGNRLLSIFKIR